MEITSASSEFLVGVPIIYFASALCEVGIFIHIFIDRKGTLTWQRSEATCPRSWDHHVSRPRAWPSVSWHLDVRVAGDVEAVTLRLSDW